MESLESSESDGQITRPGATPRFGGPLAGHVGKLMPDLLEFLLYKLVVIQITP